MAAMEGAEVKEAPIVDAISSVLTNIAEQRRIAYCRSSIRLVSTVENKYPLADTIMKSSTGSKVNGNLEGPGSAEFNDGHTYEGVFQNGVMHGKGQYTWKDGVVYEGDFSNCKLTGVGKYTWSDGSTYSGDVVDSLRHGQGVYHSSSTGGTFTGQWVKGMRHGRGKLVYDSESESYYDGEWVDNQQEGYGVRRYRSGNVYEGNWHHNKRHGDGTMHWYDRGEEYSGQWVNGIQHGHGEHMWIIERNDNAQYPICNRYVGDWKNGVREGNGTFYYANGAVYSGEWLNNQKHGRGKFVSQSGQVFEGRFQFDRMVGGAVHGGSEAEEEGGLVRPKTPLGSLIGDIDHSDLVAGGSITEKFNLEIIRLLPPNTDTQHELRQVHCVLLRYITQLKKIYHSYSSLGKLTPSCPGDNTSTGEKMNKMQFWRLLKDCQIHHLGLTLFDTDTVIDPKLSSHDPHKTFLMREFLQALVFLGHHIYNEKEKRSKQLCWCLSELLSAHILPKACAMRGVLYSQPVELAQLALSYQLKMWNIYQSIAQKCLVGKQIVNMRDIMLLLKNCDLITLTLDASAIVKILVDDNPQAVDEEDYNLEIEVTFLEFFEALLECAIQWYKGEEHHQLQRQASQEQIVKVTVSLVEEDEPVTEDVGNEVESSIQSVPESSYSHTPDIDEHTSSYGSAVADSEDIPGLGKEGDDDDDDDSSDGASSEDCRVGTSEQDSHVTDVHNVKQWKDMLQMFFVEHLFSKTVY